MEEQSKKKPNKVANIIINVILGIIIIFSAIVTVSVLTSRAEGYIPKFFGNIFCTVQSESMEPVFKKGDMLFVKALSLEEVNKLEGCSEVGENGLPVKEDGDVITFWTTIQGQRVLNTHRIVERKEITHVDETTGDTIVDDVFFITKGDNNSTLDTTNVENDAVVGIWSTKKIGGIGGVVDFLNSPLGFGLCVLLPVALFFLYELYSLIMLLAKNKIQKQKAMDEEAIKQKAIEEYLRSQGIDPATANASVAPASEKSAENDTNKDVNN